jgi:hypothetical protein
MLWRQIMVNLLSKKKTLLTPQQNTVQHDHEPLSKTYWQDRGNLMVSEISNSDWELV